MSGFEKLQGYTPLTKRAVIYARVSTDKQEEDGTSLDTQVENCTRYAQSRQLQVIETFREVYTGSLYRERSGLTKLRAMARNGEFEALIINTFDRLSRNQTHLAVLIDEMDNLKINIECVNEKFDDTTAGQFMRSAMAFVAQVEHEKIAERTMTGRRKRVLEGKLNPGWKPRFGYVWAGYRKERFEINEAEALIVRRMFAMYAFEGYTFARIARTFDEEGMPTPTGRGHWSDATVRRILEDPAYIGRETAFKYDSKADVHTGKHRSFRKPYEESIALPENVTPAIVDESTFYAVQEKIKINRAESLRNNHYPHSDLLRCGFIRCGYCKRAMGAANACKPRGKDAYTTREYRCHNRGAEKFACPKRPVISIKRIDNAAWQYVGEIIQDFSLVEKAIQLARGQDGFSADLKAIEQSIRSAQAQQDQLMEDLKQSQDGTPKLKGRARQLVLDEFEKIETYLTKLEEEKRQVLSGHQQWEEVQSEVDAFLAWCLNARETYPNATYEEKRRALRVLGIMAYVYREDDTEHDRYEIRIRIPDIVSHTS